MKNSIIRIALLGPESTGKTTLALQLAAHYQTVWVPEYSREYMEVLGRKYTREDILITLREQCRQEDLAMEKANTLLFADTDPIIAKVWMEDVFQETPEEIQQIIEERKYDLYLLLTPDLPFVVDPVRENPERREYLFRWYKKELEERHFCYSVISGEGAMRLENAKRAVENFLRDQRKT
ncbi:MAG TPA: ATP-binding protein [Bacteroidia bacterium]|nr:ATP-binding protein [Bacteroidia bacterium]